MKKHVLVVIILLTLVWGGFSLPCETQASCNPVYHVVKAGETLAQIAYYYGVSVSAISKANNLWNPDVIYTGQTLLIPMDCTPPPPPDDHGCTTTHVVKRGEYLKVIAAKYGTTWQAIAELNHLRNPNVIYSGQRLQIPSKCSTVKPDKDKAWTGQYWNNPALAGSPSFTRKESAVDFSWGLGGPGDGVYHDYFSARWTRTRTFTAGYYRFNVWVDDGVRVWVDEQLLIDKWQDTALAYYQSDIKYMTAGNHSLRIEYYEHTGGAQIKFQIQASAAPKGTDAKDDKTPTNPIVDHKAQWKGEYYPYRTWESCCPIVRYEPKIFFDWGKGSPFPGYREDDFNVRWTKSVYFEKGRYYFTVEVDDAINFTIDGNTVLGEWHDTNGAAYTVYYDIPKTGTYPVKIEYYEATGNAKIKITVSGPPNSW
jgi:LysM repeat protein